MSAVGDCEVADRRVAHLSTQRLPSAADWPAVLSRHPRLLHADSGLYQRALRLDLPDFERAPEWWTQGGNLYLDHFDEAGFIEVPLPALQQHDVLLMQNAAPVPNHSAIYLGGGRIL